MTRREAVVAWLVSLGYTAYVCVVAAVAVWLLPAAEAFLVGLVVGIGPLVAWTIVKAG